MTKANCELTGDWVNVPTYWACYSKTVKDEHIFIHGEVVSHCPAGCHTRILHANHQWRKHGTFVELPTSEIRKLPVECPIAVEPDITPILDEIQRTLARFRIDNPAS